MPEPAALDLPLATEADPSGLRCPRNSRAACVRRVLTIPLHATLFSLLTPTVLEVWSYP